MSCAISGKEIKLQDLNYWNVDLQEAYYSPLEVNERPKAIRMVSYFHYCVSISIDQDS